jgi:hypothetical protein
VLLCACSTLGAPEDCTMDPGLRLASPARCCALPCHSAGPAAARRSQSESQLESGVAAGMRLRRRFGGVTVAPWWRFTLGTLEPLPTGKSRGVSPIRYERYEPYERYERYEPYEPYERYERGVFHERYERYEYYWYQPSSASGLRRLRRSSPSVPLPPFLSLHPLPPYAHRP